MRKKDCVNGPCIIGKLFINDLFQTLLCIINNPHIKVVRR